MMKNRQHKHKGKPHTQEKSQDAATFMEDAIAETVHPNGLRPNVYVIEQPAELHV